MMKYSISQLTHALTDAIRNQKADEVKSLLETKKININSPLPMLMQTPLIFAVFSKNSLAVDYILQHNPDVTVHDSQNLSVIDYLKHFQNISSQSKQIILRKTLSEAVKMGNDQEIKKIFTFKDIKADKVDDDENSVLHLVAKFGQLKLIPSFISYITLRNKKSNENDTPVDTAARYGQFDIIMAFLSNPAANFSRVLIICIDANKFSTFQGLLESAEEKRLLAEYRHQDEYKEDIAGLMSRAISKGLIEFIKFLAKKYPQSITRPYAGLPPLYQAIQVTDEEIFNSLLELKASIQVSDITLDKRQLKMTPREFAEELSKVPDTKADQVSRYERMIATLGQIEDSQKKENDYIEKNITQLVDSVITKLSKQPYWWALKEQKQLAAFSAETRKKIIKNRSENSEFAKCFTIPEMMEKENWVDLLVKGLQKEEKSIINKGIVSKDSIYIDRLAIVLDNCLLQLHSQMIALLPAKPLPFPSLDPFQQQSLISARVKQEFEDTFEREFDDAFGKFKSLASGELVYAKDALDMGFEKCKDLVNKFAPEVKVVGISVPTGPALVTAITLAEYIRQYYRAKEAVLMCQLFAAVNPRDRTAIVHLLAERIFFRYQFQLLNLAHGPQGISFFATCAAVRIIDYIVSNEDHQIQTTPSALAEIWRKLVSWATQKELASELQVKKSIDEVFLHGLARVTHQFAGETQELSTESTHTDQWIAKGIFENTGIIDETGKRWAAPNCKLLDYGYCFATQSEAEEKRGYTLLTKKDKQPWPEGRKWGIKSVAQAGINIFPSLKTTSPAKDTSLSTTHFSQQYTGKK